MEWVEVFEEFNKSNSKKQQKQYATSTYQSLFMNRTFRPSIINTYDFRRFNVGDKYGLILLENITTTIPQLTEIYQQKKYTKGVLLKEDNGWKVERVFEPNSAALNILINKPDWSLNSVDTMFDVEQSKYTFKSAVAFVEPDGSTWIHFYPFKLDNDDWQAIVWGENSIEKVIEDKATTVGSSAPYRKIYLHIPDVDNLTLDSSLGYVNLKRPHDNRNVTTKGKEFIQWAEIKNDTLILKAHGFLASLDPQIEVSINIKIPVWRKGISGGTNNTSVDKPSEASE